MSNKKLNRAISVLNVHHLHFFEGLEFAKLTSQPVPEDSRAWSQILVSTITGINGLGRKKGPDLIDGSDVKSANAWCSIDTVRFNGVIKAGTQSDLSGSIRYLDTTPFLFFVLWDYNPATSHERCRIWVVRPKNDTLFRRIANTWYMQLSNGQIKSNNFQLHPPLNENNNIFHNNCGNLSYPLLLKAEWTGETYIPISYDHKVLKNGLCSLILPIK